MSIMACEPAVLTRKKRGRVQTILRVAEGDRYVGDILLDGDNRVWRHADTIPADVVLKALLAYSRQSVMCDQVRGRIDGRTYLWFVVGGLAAEAAVED